jgi:orotate phosphoribosyltransferase
MAADQLKLPYMYVRPKPKAHGLGNQIEGNYEAGKRVLVIEDLISTGKSSLEVCGVLRNAGMIVEGMVSIFTYGFPQAVEAFNEANVPVHSLTGYEVLINLAIEKNIVSGDQLNTLLNWRSNPSGWNGIK